MENKYLIKEITKQGVMPLFYNADKSICVEVLRALYRGGIRVVEFTNRGGDALITFAQLIKLRNHEMPDLLLGIGTIKNKEQAEQYINAGADFIISPGYVQEIASYVNSKHLLYIPGCMTVSEIIMAENNGLKFIKLFPGELLGTRFLKSVKGLFPGLQFMPTGGVNISRDSIGDWFNAGVSAVGIGSKLISNQLMVEKRYSTIELLAKNVLGLVKEYNKEVRILQ